jgi:hypothetical protein
MLAIAAAVAGPQFLSAASATFAGSAASSSWTHTIEADADCLIVGFGGQSSASNHKIVSVTCNGISLSPIARNTDTAPGANLWYMPYPPAGLQTIVATASGTMDRGIGGGSQTFKGVGGIDITGFTNSNSATVVSTILTATRPGTLVGFTFVKSGSSVTNYVGLTSPSGIVEDVNCTGLVNTAVKNFVLGHASVPAGASTFTVTKVDTAESAINIVAILTSDVGQAFWLGTLTNTASLTTYTFSGAKLGPESPNRLIVVTISQTWSTARNVSTVTIGGVAATLITQNGVTARPCWMYAAVVPTGLTGDIVITYTGGVTGSICNVFVGYPVNATPVDAGSSSTASATTESVADVAKTAGGFTIVGGFIQNITGIVVFTQNGPATDVILECSDQPFDGAVSASAAFHNNTADTVNDDYTGTWSTSGTVAISVGSWGPPAGPSTIPATCEFMSKGTFGSDNSTYTTTSLAIGAVEATRWIFVAVNVAGVTSVNSVTVGGIACSKLFGYTQNTTQHQEVWGVFAGTNSPLAAVTSAVVVAVMSDIADRCGLAVYRVTNLASPTPVSSFSSTPAGGTVYTGNVEAKEGGFVIAGLACNDSGSNRSSTWTDLTENVDDDAEGGRYMSFASMQFGFSNPAYTVTDTVAGNTSSIGYYFAGSWR